jgi:hypothetical protein
MITQSLKTANGVDLRTPPLPDPPKRVTVGAKPNRITVACVWFRGSIYSTSEYVEKLRNMVSRHLTIPHDFVCITPETDLPEGVIRMSPPTPPVGQSVARGDEKNWWHKVGLFSPDLFGPSQRILYLDLDVIITNSLDTIASATDELCMIENFGPNKGHAAHNSSCMVWTPTEKTSRIYTQFSPDVTRELHGDQCWIWRVMQDDIRNFERYQCVSYKYEKHPQWKHRTQATSVVVFHGQPKPHSISTDPLSAHWA